MGSLNTNADGSQNKPILQKFKGAGKTVDCVTTVLVAHAIPAGFCIANKTQGEQDDIALQYLPLKFDVMMKNTEIHNFLLNGCQINDLVKS